MNVKDAEPVPRQARGGAVNVTAQSKWRDRQAQTLNLCDLLSDLLLHQLRTCHCAMALALHHPSAKEWLNDWIELKHQVLD